MLSIRTDKDTEHCVREAAARYNVSTSEYVRQAIEERLAKDAAMADPFAAGEDLFGRYGSGDGDRAERDEERLRDKLKAKHRAA